LEISLWVREVSDYVKLTFRFGLVDSDALGRDLLFVLGLQLVEWVQAWFVLGWVIVQ
jgi:hypothetical protein